ncbi:MAG: SUMF1/EgtB/PvdO family nonheme iron enzyme, partial [Candidatus Aminicenantes bacterium]|nr:SUMF1/EgtB/PvdO family nonheme iron enzyme [Candidatus Aminicenantes bacterium]
ENYSHQAVKETFMFARKQFRGIAVFTLFIFTCFVLTLDYSYSQEENPLLKAQGLYKQGDFIDAVKVLEVFIEKNKNNETEQKRLAEANYLLAKMYYEAGDDSQVEMNLAKALQADRGVGRDEAVESFKSIVDRLRKALPATEPHAGDVKKIIVNGVDFEMVWIPPGEFLMGSSPLGVMGKNNHDEVPQHKVAISKGFWLGKFEVTQRQWDVAGNPLSYFKNVGPNAPVEMVSWTDCQKFIKKLNAKSGSLFRLPTEAEWEYACRAGATVESTGNFDIFAWYIRNSGGSTHPVGQKHPNAFGLYDMLGNVWEWCEDWYSRIYYQNSPAINPPGPLVGSKRVNRGGSYYELEPRVCNAYRNSDYPDYRSYRLGFRLARTGE